MKEIRKPKFPQTLKLNVVTKPKLARNRHSKMLAAKNRPEAMGTRDMSASNIEIRGAGVKQDAISRIQKM